MRSSCAWRRWLPAVTVALLLAAGCADEPDTAPATTGGPSATSPTPDRSADPSTEAVSVRLSVSGGIAGVHESYEVTRDDAPTGMTAEQVERVLALAGDPSVRGFAPERSRAAVPCCDLRVFDVTVRYADGSRTRFRSAETLEAPREVERLVSLLSQPR
ncbi:MAG TPA: hypothetical protein VHG70_02515 [Nocardioidaceae bacterium]|nr:hypothetical protein [Nocardioidaceae bacterium]